MCVATLTARSSTPMTIIGATSSPRTNRNEVQLSLVRRGSPATSGTSGFAAGVVFDVDGLGLTLFCHGSPRSDTEIITTATTDERLRGILGGVEQRTVVGGHTHRQFDRRVDGWRVVNAGSVGMPYEGRPGAYCWALLGPGVELRRTAYDVDRAVVALRE